jgi:hypothetical protein
MKHKLQLNYRWLLSAFLGCGALMLSPGQLQGQIAQKASQAARQASISNPPVSHDHSVNIDQLIQKLIEQMALSGVVLANEGTASTRLRRSSEIPPGPAPMLSFRAFDREDRYRLGKLDLVVDDAGH